MSHARIVLADDHALLLDGLRKLLTPEFDVVGAVTDGRSAVEAFLRYRPDLLLLDIGLPLLNGIEAALQVRTQAPEARIVFVTMQTQRHYVEEAFQVGARGYVLKQTAATELLSAIRAVLSGRSYVSPLIAEKLGPVPSHLNKSAVELFGGTLTPRQREVLQLVAEGKSGKEIAAILGISPRTVEFHKAGIMETVGVRTTAELTRYALELGIAGT
jgi:DNA-binding NarL/FixJ family response regulator